jgi:hypothetical protein
MMATGTVHMAMRNFLFTGVADGFDLNIER